MAKQKKRERMECQHCGSIRSGMNNPKLFERCSVHGFGSDITLLDLFAGMAMQGLVAGWGMEADGDPKDNVYKIAEDSYELAKAMLEERENILKGDSNA